MTSTTDRQSWLDFAKGLGILFVMIGHSRLYTASTLVYIFHMPLFFFLSGFVYSGAKYSGGQFLRRKAMRLMIPYYILGIPMLIACTVQDAASVGFNLRLLNANAQWARFISYLIQDRFGTLWYIACLFWMNCLFFLILKLCRQNLKAAAVVAVAMAVLAALYYRLGGGSLPGNIDTGFAMMPFFLCGYAARKHDLFASARIQKRPLSHFAVFLVVSLIAGLLNFLYARQKVDIYYNVYGCLPLMYLGSFAGIFAILCLAQKAQNRELEYIGRNSILFYAWHQAIIFPLVDAVLLRLHILQGETFGARAGESLLCIAVSFAVLWIPTEILKKFRIGALFGVR